MLDGGYFLPRNLGVGENCPRYGDFLTFVGHDMVKKVRNDVRQHRALAVV